jgi:hypothetical protein
MRYLYFCLFLFVACQPSTPEEFEAEGKIWMRSMVKELKLVHSKDDLQKSIPFISKKYNQLAKLILLVKSKYKKNWIINDSENEEFILLKEQLDRIFLLPGAKEIFETAQLEALQILDSIE